jgi:hypothetical protein
MVHTFTWCRCGMAWAIVVVEAMAATAITAAMNDFMDVFLFVFRLG